MENDGHVLSWEFTTIEQTASMAQEVNWLHLASLPDVAGGAPPARSGDACST